MAAVMSVSAMPYTMMTSAKTSAMTAGMKGTGLSAVTGKHNNR